MNKPPRKDFQCIRAKKVAIFVVWDKKEAKYKKYGNLSIHVEWVEGTLINDVTQRGEDNKAYGQRG